MRDTQEAETFDVAEEGAEVASTEDTEEESAEAAAN
jgi:hypothetical protein